MRIAALCIFNWKRDKMFTAEQITSAFDGFLFPWLNARQDHNVKLEHVEWLRHVIFGNPQMLSDPTRVNEFLTARGEPCENVELIHSTIGTHPHWLTVLTSDPVKTKRDYAALGYAFESDEFLMRLPNLANHLQAPNPQVRVTRVQSEKESEWLNQKTGVLLVDPTRLHDPSIAYYYISRDDLPAAFGRVAMTSDGIAGPDKIRTRPEYQRQGLAFELMNAMHREAVARGCTEAVLLSSVEGRALYYKLGYLDVAQVVVFVSGRGEE